MTKTVLDAQALTKVAINGLLEKKGLRITRMDLRAAEGAVTDFFILCTGTSDTHVDALAQSVIHEMRKVDERPVSKEGMTQCQWVLLDFVNVVVHIFQRDTRDFFRLEDLWGDAPTEHIDEESFAQ